MGALQMRRIENPERIDQFNRDITNLIDSTDLNPIEIVGVLNMVILGLTRVLSSNASFGGSEVSTGIVTQTENGDVAVGTISAKE